jgi:hypothetical protein
MGGDMGGDMGGEFQLEDVNVGAGDNATTDMGRVVTNTNNNGTERDAIKAVSDRKRVSNTGQV